MTNLEIFLDSRFRGNDTKTRFFRGLNLWILYLKVSGFSYFGEINISEKNPLRVLKILPPKSGKYFIPDSPPLHGEQRHNTRSAQYACRDTVYYAHGMRLKSKAKKTDSKNAHHKSSYTPIKIDAGGAHIMGGNLGNKSPQTP